MWALYRDLPHTKLSPTHAHSQKSVLRRVKIAGTLKLSHQQPNLQTFPITHHSPTSSPSSSSPCTSPALSASPVNQRGRRLLPVRPCKRQIHHPLPHRGEQKKGDDGFMASRPTKSQQPIPTHHKLQIRRRKHPH